MKKMILLLFYVTSINSFSQLADINKIVCDNYEKQIYNDPGIDYSKYKSYSLISTNQFLKRKQQTIQEKQLEFFLTNFIFSYCGLNYIPLRDSIKPDLLFVYDYSNDYKEKYIAPKTYSIPFWKSGSTSTTTINSSSSGNLIISGDINILGKGTSNSGSTINTTSSGEWTTMEVQKPGYTDGKYFPSFSIIIYDTSDENKIWEGTGTGTSIDQDFRLAGQYIMTYLGFEIPIGSFKDEDLFLDNNGWLGIALVPYNSEGQNFYPIVTNIIKNSPVYKSGLKFGDVVISINGSSTLNKPSKQIAKLIKGNSGTKITFSIERNGKIINKILIKADKPFVNK